MVMVGDDIVLPCQLEPAMDAVYMTMEWGRPDLDPRFVYVWHDGQELLVDQNKAYKGRASLSISKLKHGDLSLKLSKAKISDNGTYRCFIPKLSKEYFLELLVGKLIDYALQFASHSPIFTLTLFHTHTHTHTLTHQEQFGVHCLVKETSTCKQEESGIEPWD